MKVINYKRFAHFETNYIKEFFLFLFNEGRTKREFIDFKINELAWKNVNNVYNKLAKIGKIINSKWVIIDNKVNTINTIFYVSEKGS